MNDAILRLRGLRIACGLTQDDIADVVGVKPKQVYLWEAGRHEMPSTKLALYVRAVQASPEDVIALLVKDALVDPEKRVQELLKTKEGKQQLKRAATSILEKKPKKKRTNSRDQRGQ